MVQQEVRAKLTFRPSIAKQPYPVISFYKGNWKYQVLVNADNLGAKAAGS